MIYTFHVLIPYIPEILPIDSTDFHTFPYPGVVSTTSRIVFWGCNGRLHQQGPPAGVPPITTTSSDIKTKNRKRKLHIFNINNKLHKLKLFTVSLSVMFVQKLPYTKQPRFPNRNSQAVWRCVNPALQLLYICIDVHGILPAHPVRSVTMV